MILVEEYLAAPCAELSIPYWKAKHISIPADMRVIHDSCFTAETDWRDERYFRLIHTLHDVRDGVPAGYMLTTGTDLGEMAEIISASYVDIHMTAVDLRAEIDPSVYVPELRVIARETVSGRGVGCGIAAFDVETGEISLEWIQVLPNARRKGIGRALVDELIRRGRANAGFATVSGKADTPGTEAFYRSCGFTGGDIWHVQKRRCKKT